MSADVIRHRRKIRLGLSNMLVMPEAFIQFRTQIGLETENLKEFKAPPLPPSLKWRYAKIAAEYFSKLLLALLFSATIFSTLFLNGFLRGGRDRLTFHPFFSYIFDLMLQPAVLFVMLALGAALIVDGLIQVFRPPVQTNLQKFSLAMCDLDEITYDENGEFIPYHKLTQDKRIAVNDILWRLCLACQALLDQRSDNGFAGGRKALDLKLSAQQEKELRDYLETIRYLLTIEQDARHASKASEAFQEKSQVCDATTAVNTLATAYQYLPEFLKPFKRARFVSRTSKMGFIPNLLLLGIGLTILFVSMLIFFNGAQFFSIFMYYMMPFLSDLLSRPISYIEFYTNWVSSILIGSLAISLVMVIIAVNNLLHNSFAFATYKQYGQRYKEGIKQGRHENTLTFGPESSENIGFVKKRFFLFGTIFRGLTCGAVDITPDNRLLFLGVEIRKYWHGLHNTKSQNTHQHFYLFLFNASFYAAAAWLLSDIFIFSGAEFLVSLGTSIPIGSILIVLPLAALLNVVLTFGVGRGNERPQPIRPFQGIRNELTTYARETVNALSLGLLEHDPKKGKSKKATPITRPGSYDWHLNLTTFNPEQIILGYGGLACITVALGLLVAGSTGILLPIILAAVGGISFIIRLDRLNNMSLSLVAAANNQTAPNETHQLEVPITPEPGAQFILLIKVALFFFSLLLLILLTPSVGLVDINDFPVNPLHLFFAFAFAFIGWPLIKRVNTILSAPPKTESEKMAHRQDQVAKVSVVDEKYVLLTRGENLDIQMSEVDADADVVLPIADAQRRAGVAPRSHAHSRASSNTSSGSDGPMLLYSGSEGGDEVPEDEDEVFESGDEIRSRENTLSRLGGASDDPHAGKQTLLGTFSRMFFHDQKDAKSSLRKKEGEPLLPASSNRRQEKTCALQ